MDKTSWTYCTNLEIDVFGLGLGLAGQRVFVDQQHVCMSNHSINNCLLVYKEECITNQ